MSNHKLRIWEPQTFYLVTNRCFQGQCLLRPDDSLNPLVISWLRRTVRIYGLELYAALFLGDRFALIVRAPKKNLSKAMGYFQGNLAKAVNRVRGRRDTVFPDRFDAVPIFEDALLDQMRKLLRRAVELGEVSQPGEWPGYTSWHQMVQEKSPWLDAKVELPPLTKLPEWAELDDQEYADKVRALVAEPPPSQPTASEDDAWMWPALPGVGATAVRERDWSARSSGPRPTRRRLLCHTGCPKRRHYFKSRCQRIRRRYDLALTLWRQGKPAIFPEGTFPPGWCEVSDGRSQLASPDVEAIEEAA